MLFSKHIFSICNITCNTFTKKLPATEKYLFFLITEGACFIHLNIWSEVFKSLYECFQNKQNSTTWTLSLLAKYSPCSIQFNTQMQCNYVLCLSFKFSAMHQRRLTTADVQVIFILY
jgi:hypothetical protein